MKIVIEGALTDEVVINTIIPAIRKAVNEKDIELDQLLYGESFKDEDGKRIDPRTVTIVHNKVTDQQRTEITEILREVYQQGYICGIRDEAFSDYVDDIVEVIEGGEDNEPKE